MCQVFAVVPGNAATRSSVVSRFGVSSGSAKYVRRCFVVTGVVLSVGIAVPV